MAASRTLNASSSTQCPCHRRGRLLSVATVAVLASLPTQSALWLSLASVTGLGLSWAALRIMWTEVLQSRRENAADRAAAAAAYATCSVFVPPSTQSSPRR